MASTTFWPCETSTSTCRSFATISSGLYRFLAIAVLLDVKDIPQLGPLQWGWITILLILVEPFSQPISNQTHLWQPSSAAIERQPQRCTRSIPYCQRTIHDARYSWRAF